MDNLKILWNPSTVSPMDLNLDETHPILFARKKNAKDFPEPLVVEIGFYDYNNYELYEDPQAKKEWWLNQENDTVYPREIACWMPMPCPIDVSK